jgi:hypothetical protein
LLVVVAAALMLVGWRARRQRQSGVTAPLQVPATLGASTLDVDGWYVATTPVDEPLERIAVHGLGFRARATVSVHPEGIVLERRGSDAVHLPSGDLRTAGRATWAIDRVVEPEGLIVIGWMLGSTPVDTYLRLPDRTDAEQLLAAVTDMLPGSAPTPDPAEEVAS